MKFYKLCLWKAYFEKGYGITSYIKYLIVIFGLYSAFQSQSITITLVLAFVYGISCFFIGWAWYHYGIITSEIEVHNTFDLFVKEMRKKRKV